MNSRVVPLPTAPGRSTVDFIVGTNEGSTVTDGLLHCSCCPSHSMTMLLPSIRDRCRYEGSTVTDGSKHPTVVAESFVDIDPFDVVGGHVA